MENFPHKSAARTEGMLKKTSVVASISLRRTLSGDKLSGIVK